MSIKTELEKRVLNVPSSHGINAKRIAMSYFYDHSCSSNIPAQLRMYTIEGMTFELRSLIRNGSNQRKHLSPQGYFLQSRYSVKRDYEDYYIQLDLLSYKELTKLIDRLRKQAATLSSHSISLMIYRDEKKENDKFIYNKVT